MKHSLLKRTLDNITVVIVAISNFKNNHLKIFNKTKKFFKIFKKPVFTKSAFKLKVPKKA